MTQAYLESTRVALGDLNNSALEIGKGGEGKIFIHPSSQNECIKLYKDSEDRNNRADKIAAMIRQVPEAVQVSVSGVNTVQMAWPTDRVIDESGNFLGYTMPFVDIQKDAWKGFDVTQPALRRQRKIPQGARVRLVIALNVAKLMQSLHAAGHYIIDLKPENLLVYNTSVPERAGYVALVDCDSFIVHDRKNDRTMGKPVATAEYEHPEALNSADESRWIRENPREQDMWAAATLFFKLLNGNLHPMQGIPKLADESTSSNPERLFEAAQYYPYGRIPSRLLKPHEDSTHHWMDDELRGLFDRTFMLEGTPVVRDWIRVLSRLNSDAQECDRDVDHWKLGKYCGTCALQAPFAPASQSSIPLAATTVVSPSSPTPAVKQRSNSIKSSVKRIFSRALTILFVFGGLSFVIFKYNITQWGVKGIEENFLWNSTGHRLASDFVGRTIFAVPKNEAEIWSVFLESDGGALYTYASGNTKNAQYTTKGREICFKFLNESGGVDRACRELEPHDQGYRWVDPELDLHSADIVFSALGNVQLQGNKLLQGVREWPGSLVIGRRNSAVWIALLESTGSIRFTWSSGVKVKGQYRFHENSICFELPGRSTDCPKVARGNARTVWRSENPEIGVSEIIYVGGIDAGV